MLVGQSPAELQSCIDFAIGISADARDAEAAKRLSEFLMSTAVDDILAAKGVEAKRVLDKQGSAHSDRPMSRGGTDGDESFGGSGELLMIADDRLPRWQVVRQQPPRHSDTCGKAHPAGKYETNRFSNLGGAAVISHHFASR